jgi:hypothetical protein
LCLFFNDKYMYGTNMLRFFKSHARYFYPYVNILEKLLDGSLYKQQNIYIYISTIVMHAERKKNSIVKYHNS